jgi:hypothetical protein
MQKLLTSLWAPVFAFLFWADEPAQDPSRQLAAYQQAFPQEKVYLHLDKPYYHAGDTLWFKSYLVDASFHLPDSVSRILYVDLIEDRRGVLLQHLQVKSDNGFGNGTLTLADTLPAGAYRVRAYTNWMRNFPEENFFEKEFRVYRDKAESMTESQWKELAKVADCQFFPEGGDWIAGLQSRVAFKAINKAGKGVATTGFVLANSRDTVMTFATRHLGMGTFTFTPQPGQSYTAHLKQPDGTLQTYPLPAVQPSGYVMLVDNISRKDVSRVILSHNFPETKDIVILAHQRGVVCYTAKAQVGKGMSAITIPKKAFPSEGVVQLTLFDQAGLPQCERLIFTAKEEPLRVSIQSDKTVYAPRGKVDLEITVRDTEGKPVQGNFSLAVTDSKQVIPEPYSETIQSYFLLSSDVKLQRDRQAYFSDLRGSVEQPASYFDPANEQAAANLDLLLMTQGWRRFTWKDVLRKDYPPTSYPLETGFIIAGKVAQPNGQQSKKPVNVTLMLSSGNGERNIWMAEADASGRFLFQGLEYSDTTGVLVQGVKTSGGRNLAFALDETSVSLPPVKARQSVDYSVSQAALENFLQRSREIEELQTKLRLNKVQILKEVEVKATRTETDQRRAVYGHADNTLVVDQNSCAGALNVLQLLQGRVAGVQVTGSGMNMSVNIRGAANFSGPIQPLFLLDGMPVDISILTSIPPCDVEAIDVLKGSAAIYGSRGAGGVISILTRRGNKSYDASNDPALGILLAKRIGYATPRQFYSPRYDLNVAPSPLPDYRSTVYWQPVVQTDVNGKANVTFWNPDEKTIMRVVVEGMNYRGMPAVGSYTYQVR